MNNCTRNFCCTWIFFSCIIFFFHFFFQLSNLYCLSHPCFDTSKPGGQILTCKKKENDWWQTPVLTFMAKTLRPVIFLLNYHLLVNSAPWNFCCQHLDFLFLLRSFDGETSVCVCFSLTLPIRGYMCWIIILLTPFSEHLLLWQIMRQNRRHKWHANSNFLVLSWTLWVFNAPYHYFNLLPSLFQLFFLANVHSFFTLTLVLSKLLTLGERHIRGITSYINCTWFLLILRLT